MCKLTKSLLFCFITYINELNYTVSMKTRSAYAFLALISTFIIFKQHQVELCTGWQISMFVLQFKGRLTALSPLLENFVGH